MRSAWRSCSSSSFSLAASNHSTNYRPIHQPTSRKEVNTMSRNELIAKIETLRNLEALIEEAKGKQKLSVTALKLRWKQSKQRSYLPEVILCAGHLFSLLALIPSLSRRNSERKYTKPLLNKSHPADSVSAHEKSPLSERLPSHRQRASYHTPKERVQ